MSEIGCAFGTNTVTCTLEAGSGCPGVDGGPHYFIWLEDGDSERRCMDCGTGQTEALKEVANGR